MKTAVAFIIIVTIAFRPLLAEGSGKSQTALELYGEKRIQNWAEVVNRHLDARGVNVAIVARCGRERGDLPSGIDFTHAGIAVFEAVKNADGEIYYTYTVYNLYQGAEGRKDRSHLVQDFMFDMCAGGVEPEIGVIVPTEGLQQRILKVLRSPVRTELHNPDYNLLANPYDKRYDNCVSYILKLTMSAIYATDDEDRIAQNIRDYYVAQEVELNGLERFGSKFLSGVTMKDQDRTVQTVTFGSIGRFLETYDLQKERFIVGMAAEETSPTLTN